ncbi:putative baseplate assembly protein [Umezawaea beigongshangensis]|uniref:putative baseplate assembly protein n=1 Tax=Umezawaea beigongshangensis TaxID=2780383 RepID=UPI0018F1C02C|nr:putative baseplate assembly protein [Umezawaea beigongshangensis]
MTSSTGSTGSAAVSCRADGRRAKVRERRRNGVDGVEVSDDGLTLTVTFLGRAPADLAPENVRIDGGRRIRDVRAVEVRVESSEDAELDDRAHVVLNRVGDHSAYSLSVVRPDARGRPGTEPYADFDPRYASAEFAFHQSCPSEVDCARHDECPPRREPPPVIDYLARDDLSLRRLLLDRLTLTTPRWVERHVPDLGVTLVELLAHAGDQLGYQQDAVAAEAYLDTARRRVSVRRHARLVDYAMHDGCNARAVVVLDVDRPVELEPGEHRFAAIDLHRVDPLRRPALGPVITEEELDDLPPETACEVFEPLGTAGATLHPAHGEIRFWTWGDRECCLPLGATAATLRDEWLWHGDEQGGDEHGGDEHGGDEHGGEQGGEQGEERGGNHGPRERALHLRPGDLLVIEEVVGPRTGAAADADPAHRAVVRLLTVTPDVDDLYDQPVVGVTWAVEDALEFSACLSSRGGQDCCPLEDVTVARGNAVLVDHGRGGFSELIRVPPAGVVPADCAPPEFGCSGGGADDPGAALIGALLTRTGDRAPLGVADVRALSDVLGEAATTRAGIVVDLDAGEERVLPDTAGEQHAALRTLLARVSYPSAPRRFRPLLQGVPVTQRAPFPAPRVVAAGQAGVLATIPGRVEARLTELWRRVRGGGRLTRAHLDELEVLFGERVLTALHVTERSARALRELLSRHDELLAGKTRRLDVLRERALAGGVLDEGVVWELAQTWGGGYAEGLAPDDPALTGSARSALTSDPRAALPSVVLSERGTDGPVWTPRRDLLDSGPRDLHVVGELDDDAVAAGRLALRFGDGERGAAPPAGRVLVASYRVGGGTAGNVGAEAVGHLVVRGGDLAGVLGLRNPLAAVGGTDPEPVSEVRSLAPLALRRTLLRAVTAADYAELASAVPGVQRAAAELRWTGAGREVRVVVDPVGRGEAGTELLDAVAAALRPVRRIGHQVVVGPAVLVPLDVEIAVRVAAGHQRGHVLTALSRALRAVFDPDALSFGEPVRTSRLVAVAAAVPGVVTAHVVRLRRLFGQDRGELAAGLLTTGPLEIAQLDDDPDLPENGRLTLTAGGGR